jgi:NDP-sugar pyrophosphorylase family protein
VPSTAIVLAGGRGTRLTQVVTDRPKPLADIAGRPFLEFLLRRLADQGLRRVVLATGYMAEAIERHFSHDFDGLELVFSVEREPLGTGGAIRQAFEKAASDQALVLNGDTFCTMDLAALAKAHRERGLAGTIGLVRVPDTSRYGRVEVSASGSIRRFHEKSPVAQPGLINAGIYLLEREALELAPKQDRFSFETDVLQAHADRFAAFEDDCFFIDIGIPEDYRAAQSLLPMHAGA